jgi:hypothetical protein
MKFFLGLCLLCSATLYAVHPVASYIFPAGGQIGTEVDVKVGGMYFHGFADFEMLGEGIEHSPKVEAIDTLYFQGPLIYQPASQKAEDYPLDHIGKVKIAKDAKLGKRLWSCQTIQGKTALMEFIIGKYPETVEVEREGDSTPVEVKHLPITLNGRIHPREDVDFWSIHLKEGQHASCSLNSTQLGYPLEPILEVIGPDGRRVYGKTVYKGADPTLYFRADTTGKYLIKVTDARSYGGQNYVYRLTILDEPTPTYIFPLGGKQGEEVSLEVGGPGLETSRQTVLLNNSTSIQTLEVEDGVPFRLDVDEYPEFLENPRNPLTIPSVANGRISEAGQVDEWQVQLSAKSSVNVSIMAATLGSPLDSYLEVYGPDEKLIKNNDDSSKGNPDSALLIQAQQEGVYKIRISERYPNRGGPEYTYRLKITPPPPKESPKEDFRLTIGAPYLNVQPTVPPEEGSKPQRTRGTGLVLTLEAPATYKKNFELRFEGLPDGVMPSDTVISQRKNTLEVYFDATPEVEPQVAEVSIFASYPVDDKNTIERKGDVLVPEGYPATEKIQLIIAPFVPFQHTGLYSLYNDVPAGSTMVKNYALERFGYDGPITVKLGERQGRTLQGVTAEPMYLPAGTSEFDFRIQYPAEMELGRTARIQLQLEAEYIDSNGQKHIISHTSFERNNQMITIAANGQLALRPEPQNLKLRPNTTSPIQFHVQRGKELIDRPIRLEIVPPLHLAGAFSCKTVLVPPRMDRVQMVLKCHEELPARITPLVIRATTHDDNPDRHLAEVTLEIVQ